MNGTGILSPEDWPKLQAMGIIRENIFCCSSSTPLKPKMQKSVKKWSWIKVWSVLVIRTFTDCEDGKERNSFFLSAPKTALFCWAKGGYITELSLEAQFCLYRLRRVGDCSWKENSTICWLDHARLCLRPWFLRFSLENEFVSGIGSRCCCCPLLWLAAGLKHYWHLLIQTVLAGELQVGCGQSSKLGDIARCPSVQAMLVMQ